MLSRVRNMKHVPYLVNSLSNFAYSFYITQQFCCLAEIKHVIFNNV